jgi:membrane protein YdbS with pleckstrin-like domain
MLTAVRHALEAVEAQKTALPLAAPIVTTRWEQWRPVIGMITLLLAFGAGVMAMVLGDPRWLFGTVAFAILFVVLVGLTVEQSE